MLKIPDLSFNRTKIKKYVNRLFQFHSNLTFISTLKHKPQTQANLAAVHCIPHSRLKALCVETKVLEAGWAGVQPGPDRSSEPLSDLSAKRNR